LHDAAAMNFDRLLGRVQFRGLRFCALDNRESPNRFSGPVVPPPVVSGTFFFTGALRNSSTLLQLNRALTAPATKMPAMPSTMMASKPKLFFRRYLPHNPTKKPIIIDKMMHGAPRFPVRNAPEIYFGKEIFNPWKRGQAERRRGVLRRRKVW